MAFVEASQKTVRFRLIAGKSSLYIAPDRPLRLDEDAGRYGQVAEWFKAHAWNACVRESVPRVRIPPCPPFFQAPPGSVRCSPDLTRPAIQHATYPAGSRRGGGEQFLRPCRRPGAACVTEPAPAGAPQASRCGFGSSSLWTIRGKVTRFNARSSQTAPWRMRLGGGCGTGTWPIQGRQGRHGSRPLVSRACASPDAVVIDGSGEPAADGEPGNRAVGIAANPNRPVARR